MSSRDLAKTVFHDLPLLTTTYHDLPQIVQIDTGTELSARCTFKSPAIALIYHHSADVIAVSQILQLQPTAYLPLPQLLRAEQ